MEEHIQDQNYDPPKEIPSSEVTHTGKAASLQEKGSSVKEDLPPRPASEYIPNNDSDRVSLASYKQKLDHASSYHEIDDGSYYDNELSFRSVAPVDVSVDKLSVDIDLRPSLYQSVINFVKGRNTKDIPKQKKILDDVSATMTSGTLTAILGASGSGKTTFLNILAHRMNSKRLQKTGTIRYNGNATLSSIRSAYVMQQDILLATLTARETLHYAAELRLPPPTTAAERRKIVDEVILELGLKECADTRIGDNEHKGCSGGEKRRTSLGVQLLANPSVLFLDEVTTGLDATSAHQLVRTLKQLARNGRTIITTIHQPRSEIWGLFDNLVLLTGGVPVYCGPAEKSLEYFEQQGYPIPPFVNPAEHLIELAAIDSRSPELESISTARVAGLKQTWKDKPLAIPVATEQTERPPEVNGSEHAPMRAGFLRQVRVQTARAFKTTYRDPLGMSGTLVEAALLAVLTGWIFFSLDGSLAGIRSREGALYIASGLQGYLILLFETYRLTLEIGLFDRERAENVVGVAAFLISRRLARFVTEDLPIPLIFSIIFYFMVGLRPIASEFLIFFSVLFLNQLLAVTIAMFCVALSRDFATASLIVNLNYTLQSMCSGFFVQSNQIPIWVRWLKYTAYVWYSNGALSTNEFIGTSGDPNGRLYDCPFPGGASNPQCAQWTGAFILDSLGFPPDNWIWRPIVILAAFVIGFYVSAGIVFTFHKVDMRISRAQPPIADKSTGKERLHPGSVQEARTLDVTLDNFSLSIQKKNPLGKTIKTIPILHPLSARFEPGILNVIMGVSGGGKTSLLNMMARRLHSSFSTRYQQEGTMYYGGSVPTPSVVRSISSYVCQDDDALLAHLTVRETLYFAAQLRLPKHMSKEEKHRRAESVLTKLGLRDCADNLVGNNMVKGISGGEKRRVSIAVQVLTDPRILLLDEPTSGLDAFTASSILDVLRGLAEEGRTVILTIHQSRSDLFPHFGNVLLLARGGHVVYSGPGKEMLPHFSRLGHPCPKNVNPADFALDTISVDLQSSAREQRTREKVRSLITSWTEDTTRTARIPSRISAPAELGSFKRKTTPFRIAFPLLAHRSIINFRRDPQSVLGRTWQVIGFGIIIALFFAPLKDDYDSVQSRFGFIQEYLAMYFIGMLQNVAIYPAEKAVFYREHDDGAYSVESFLTTYTVIELPFTVVTSLIFAVFASIAVGLPRTISMYLITAVNCLCIVNCGESLGIMFNTLFASTGFAVNMTSVILSLSLLMSGIMSLNIPGFLQIFNHISPGKWAVGNLMPYSLEGVTFTCKDSQRLPDGNCPIKDGKEALKLYDMDKDPKVQLIALAAVTVGYRLVAYLLLKAVRTKWDWSWKGWDWKSFRLAGRRRAGASHRQRTARVAGMFGG